MCFRGILAGKFDGVARQFSESLAVAANEEVTVIHKATNKPLAVDKKFGERWGLVTCACMTEGRAGAEGGEQSGWIVWGRPPAPLSSCL